MRKHMVTYFGFSIQLLIMVLCVLWFRSEREYEPLVVLLSSFTFIEALSVAFLNDNRLLLKRQLILAFVSFIICLIAILIIALDIQFVSFENDQLFSEETNAIPLDTIGYRTRHAIAICGLVNKSQLLTVNFVEQNEIYQIEPSTEDCTCLKIMDGDVTSPVCLTQNTQTVETTNPQIWANEIVSISQNDQFLLFCDAPSGDNITICNLGE